MQFWLIILGLPLVIYLGVALLPPGRTALFACVTLAAAIAAAWLAFVLNIAGFSGRDGQRGAYTIVALTGVTIAVALGASLQALRLRLPRDWPGWAWPLCVVIVLVAAAVPLLRGL